MELGPRARFGGEGGVGALHLEVLDDALHVISASGEVPGHRDADHPVGLGGDQCRVLEPVHLSQRDAAVARPVIDVGEHSAGFSVEDVQALRRRHDDVLGPTPGQVGGRDRTVDRGLGAQVLGPDQRARARIERPDRSRPVRIDRAFDHGELAVALDVSEGRAAARGAVQLVAPDLVAPGVVDLDRVLVAAVPETSGARRDSVGPAGQEWPDGRRGVDLLVRGGVADETAVVVVDPQLAPVRILLPVGDAVGGRSSHREVVAPGAVKIAHGGSGEHAVGGELGPPGRRRAGPAFERVGLLAERPTLD